MKRLLLCVVALSLAWGSGVSAGVASPGAISGRIVDRIGNVLPGASVHIEPGTLRLSTDREGRFAVSNLAPGTYTIEVAYVGFKSEVKSVTLNPGGAEWVEAELQPHVSEEVTVTASRFRGEAEALNQKKSASNLVDVLPAEVITSLPNTNVADAIGRLPSVSLERDEGEGKYVQVRGLEPRYTNMTINGVHVPASELAGGGRAIKLDSIPSDLVGALELHKTVSADQDGDAIGGTVNLVTRAAADRRFATLGVSGGHTDILSGRNAYQLNGAYSNRFGADKKLGLVLGGTYDWNGRGINDIEPVPGIADLPGGSSATNFVEGVDYREYRYQRERFGGTGGLDYRLGPNSSLSLRGLFSEFHNYGERWVTSAAPGAFLTPTLTDASGAFSGQVQKRTPNEQTYSVAAGGKHDLRTIVVDYTAAYSHARQDRLDQRQANTDGPSTAFLVDPSEQFFPQFHPLGGVNQLDANQYWMTNFSIANEETQSREASAAANLLVPYKAGGHNGEFKFGGKYRDGRTTNAVNQQFYDAVDGSMLQVSHALDTSVNDPDYYFGRYPQGPNLSLDAATSFFRTNPGAFTENISKEHLSNDPNDFTATEKITAVYAKNTIALGRLHFEAGVRVEHTQASYDGFSVKTGTNGLWASTVPVSGGSTYTDTLPSVSLRWELDSATNLRGVWGTTVARPDYAELVPSLRINDKKNTVSAGNPNLKPTHGRSYDLLFERFLGSVGLVSAGAFYKDLSDPIYAGSSTVIHGGIYDGYHQIQPINGPSAKIYGAEAAWQQHLGFLPGVLGGLGITANYTYTDSKATFDPSTGRTGTARLQRTTPHEYNLGLTYDKGRLAVRAAVTYNSATIFEYNYTAGADGGLFGPNGDTYLYGHTQIDAQASYQLSNGLQVVVSGLNLNNEVFGFYNGSESWMIQREFYNRTFSVGFRWNR